LDAGISASNPYTEFGTGIDFKGRDYSNAVRNYGGIYSIMTGNSASGTPAGDAGFKSSLTFYTNTGGASGTNPTEKMRIDASGNVGIGMTPVRQASVYGATSAVMSFHNSTTGSTISDGLFIGNDASNAYLYNYEATPIIFGTSASERMRISSTGSVGIGTSSITSNTILHMKDTDTQIELESTNGSNSAFIDFDGNNLQLSTNRNMIDGAFSNTGKSAAGIFMSGLSGGSHIVLSTASANNTTPTERLRIDASGNVGIGAAPSTWWANLTAVENYASSGGVFASAAVNGHFVTNAYYDGSNWRHRVTGPSNWYYHSGGVHSWHNVASGSADAVITWQERMKLDASGNLMIAKTEVNAGVVGWEARANGQTYTSMASTSNSDWTNVVYSTTGTAYRFYVGMAGTVFATSTVISAISDIRYKENIRDLDDGLSKIMALQPRKFDWKEGKGRDVKDDRGWIAQELEVIFPDMIDEWADESPEGEEPYKAVRPDLIPVLVKAMQEQQATIEALTARIAALES
jgi:hypothetical protein